MTRRRSQRHRIIRANRQRIAYTNTSPIPDADLVAAVKWLTREVNLDQTVIHAKTAGPRRRTYGVAYWGIPLATNMAGLVVREWRHLIVIADDGHEDWRDTLAHEARHIAQYRHRTFQSERDARAFASWAAKRMPR